MPGYLWRMPSRVSFRNSPRMGGGEMMVKVSQTPLGGRGMLECACMCRILYRILSI